MKIICNIPSDTYHQILELYRNDAELHKRDNLYKMVAEATQLPEGCGRLIDADYLLSILKCEKYDTCNWQNCSECINARYIRKGNVIEALTIECK